MKEISYEVRRCAKRKLGSSLLRKEVGLGAEMITQCTTFKPIAVHM